ncbi:hypothetical protein ACP70R_039781 [Stipagrostis hirtigluma subsp. patula]
MSLSYRLTASSSRFQHFHRSGALVIKPGSGFCKEKISHLGHHTRHSALPMGCR